MSEWTDSLLNHLAAHNVCGYDGRQTPASEPTALAALALLAHRRDSEAAAALQYLAALQNEVGSVGIRAEEAQPGWPTSLAVMAWRAARDPRFNPHIQQGVQWILSLRGDVMPRTPGLGHDTTLVAWPWVAGTHAWIEPTALAVAALKATGQGRHPRTREAVRMLLDRQIPGGGCNYGNTFCLGQKLRPHVQPTGIALAALAGESDPEGRLAASVAWLRRTLSADTSTPSLAWGLLGLAAHNAAPEDALAWLQAAWERVRRSDGSPYKAALVALAAKGKLQIAN